MTPDRFAHLADAYGARLDRWPVAERAAAAAFLSDHAEARAVLDAQRGLDALLDGWTVQTPPFLAEAISMRVLRRTTAMRRFQAWLTGAAAAAALAGGAAAGVTVMGASALPAVGEVSSLYGLSVLGAPLASGDSDDSDADGGL